VREKLAALPAELDAACRNAPLFIECPADYEGLLAAALSRAFSGEGFPVAKTRAEAAAVCAVTVEEGREEREVGVFYHPSIRANVTDSGGKAVWAFTVEAERTSAVTPEVAKRRAYTALANKVSETFAASFAAIDV
jgi:hypothetical protein